MKNPPKTKTRIGEDSSLQRSFSLKLTENFEKFKYRTESQKEFLQKIDEYPIVIGEGIAGTGKTLCAVYKAIQMYNNKKYGRTTIVRPIVEAGENLGFLPGGVKEKTDPYFIPIFDSYEYFYGGKVVDTLFKYGSLRTLPLAYMRGVTLNDFVIVDEAQNMTTKQLIMVLTRIGQYGKIILTGDVAQIDIKKCDCGLVTIMNKLKNIPEIGIVKFNNKDVVRNPLIQKITEAFTETED